ncbi:MAG TPA: hypothetical protein VG325_07525 [Solirubrobacteraceae bacterium]|nr:hypothetical protein [Solirubrobacteraceae bacterium]
MIALAELELVPFRYVVEGAVLTVTFCPAGVDSEKLDVDTLSTVPVDPPAAGPERALEPLLPVACCRGIAEEEAAVVGVPEPVLAVALTTP